MDMQNVSNLQIPEGAVRTIHDKDNRLLWGRVAYGVKYAGEIFQQTYSGKNLAKVAECNIPTSSYSLVISDGSVDINSITSNNWFDLSGGQRTGDWVPANVASVADYNLTSADEGTYVLSIQNFSYTNTANQNAQIHVITNQRRIGTSITRGATSFEPKVFTLEAGEHVKMIGVWIGATGTAELKGKFQLEVGSQPSSYEPYTGGIPAPNPSYPTPIHVATGTQTITIADGTNTQNFIVDLGATELCKIGNYQDYIYKSGDDWYVHKETGSYTFNGSETWQLTQTFTNTVHFVIGDYTTIFTDVVVPPDNTTIGHGLSNRFIEKANLYNVDEVGMDFHSNKNFIVGIPTSMSIATHTAWENWLASNSTSIYYALATPTDTQITDATLIGQLNAIHQWLTRYGYNSTVSGDLPLIVNRTNL